MSYIFISYSHTDSTYAHVLADTLQRLGFEPWIDDRIDYGSQWPRVIQEQLDGCAAFIVVMTPRAYASDWVQNELNRAKRKRKPIFPLLLEGDEPWLSVESTQYVDVRGSTLPPVRFYERLAQFALRKPKSTAILTPPLTFKPPEPSTPTTLPPPQVAPFTLPLLEWCDIPPGPTSGLHIKGFRISKYPVTNEQFQMFIDAPDGYGNPRWWDFSPYARRWRTENPMASRPYFAGQTLPRESVCWYEAIAFCRWLSEQTRLLITLPAELQWQRAAQDNDKREYPWGEKFDHAHCNGNKALAHTTPVDNYPSGVSPYGVYDMAGNVMEWCLTEFESGDNGIASNAPRVVRGGAWWTDLAQGCISVRTPIDPHIRINHIGFRIVSVFTGKE